MKKTKQPYRFFCIILTMCLLFSMTSTHGFDIKAYAEENAAQDISASDFTFSAEMDYGEMKTINLELETVGEGGTQKNILRVPENFLQSDIRISAKSENLPAFSVSYTQYKAKGKTNKINEKSESGTLLTGRNWWSRYNPTDSYPELELTVQDKKIKVEIRPYAALSQIKATDERKNDRPLKESCQVKDAGNNSFLIPLQYSDTQNAYEITAVKGSKLIITAVTHREATYEIKDKDGATLSTNTPYTYQVGEQDGEITIQANSAKGFDSKQYKLIIHSLEKDYFPNLQYTVKENDKTLDIGNGNFLNDAWNYKIELKQDAVCTIAVQDQTNESQPTYHWSHRMQYQQQILNDSSSNSVTVNTKDFATSGNFYDLRAVRIVDDYTYAVNVQFSYTLNHITHINAPQITSQPASASYQIGESAKWLSISASALAGTVQYQWYKNSANDTETGVPIEGAIQRSYQPEVSEVTFQYYEYTPQKEKILKHNGRVYRFSPYDLIWNEDRYYVLGFSRHHGKVISFRVDRMCDVQLAADPAIPRPQDYSVEAYGSKVFDMFDGEEKDVLLSCENDLMRVIVDRFGEDVHVEPQDKDRFYARVRIHTSPTFYGWVFQFAGGVKIISPEEIVDEYQRMCAACIQK